METIIEEDKRIRIDLNSLAEKDQKYIVDEINHKQTCSDLDDETDKESDSHCKTYIQIEMH